MFPRLPRLLRLAVYVLGVVLFLLFVLKSAPGGGGGNNANDVIFLRHLPSHGLKSSLAVRSLWTTTLKASAGGGKQGSNPTSAVKIGQGHGEGHEEDRPAAPQGAVQSNKSEHQEHKVTERSFFKDKPVVNPHDFGYLLNPGEVVCQVSKKKGAIPHPTLSQGQGHQGQGHGHVDLLVYVHAAPANMKKRQSIRQTWGDRNLLKMYNATLVFIMGRVKDSRLMHLVKMESDFYGDIVQEDFLDSYRNLTYKAIAGLKWAAKYCSKAKYIFKSDDDILVNIHRVVKHLRDVVEPTYGTERLILCNQWMRMKILRDKKSKWYIPEEDFPGEYFPPYCSGSAFLLSGDMAQLMYEASLVTKFFWVDDYYITGALIKALDIKHKRLNQAYSLNPNVAESKFRNDTKQELFFFHLHKLRLLYQLWRNMSSDAKGLLGEKAQALMTDVPHMLQMMRAQRDSGALFALLPNSSAGESGVEHENVLKSKKSVFANSETKESVHVIPEGSKSVHLKQNQLTLQGKSEGAVSERKGAELSERKVRVTESKSAITMKSKNNAVVADTRESETNSLSSGKNLPSGDGTRPVHHIANSDGNRPFHRPYDGDVVFRNEDQGRNDANLPPSDGWGTGRKLTSHT